MKKILTALLALTLSVCSAFAFSACNLGDIFGKKDGATDKGGDTPENKESAYYSVTVTGIDYLFHEQLEDKYKAGEEVEVKLSVITDVSLYVFVNEKRVSQSHYDSDYWGYKFTMPEEDITVFITMDAYHGVESCDFKDAFYMLNYFKTEDVIKIKCETSYFGVSPDTPSEVKYTTDKTNIENICAVFNCKLQPSAPPQITGGYYTVYTFYTADGQFELPISNGYAVSISFSSADYFKIVGFTPPAIANADSQCKKFNFGSCLVYSDEALQNKTGKFAYLSYLEFNESQENVDGKTPTAYVDTRYGTLKVIDDRTFTFNGSTYKVVGEEDFSTIIR